MTSFNRADLHLHTNCSDGTAEPAELVRLAVKIGFQAIAITDHDSTEGVASAQAEGKRVGVRVIPGVELSSSTNEREVHIIGLFIDPASPELKEMIDLAKQRRHDRAVLMVERLQALGVKLPTKQVMDIIGDAAAGRLHVAQALVEVGAASSISETFSRYLGFDKPAYVPKWYPTPEDCCRAIKGSGGVAVLAHPGEDVDETRVRRMVDAGCEAIEAYYPLYGAALTEAYIRLAKQLGVGVSGGSDAHGTRKENTWLGSVSLPMEVVEDLERRAKR